MLKVLDWPGAAWSRMVPESDDRRGRLWYCRYRPDDLWTGGVDCEGLSIWGSRHSRLGSLFIGGVVLHTGELAYQVVDRLFAVPIDQLWDSARRYLAIAVEIRRSITPAPVAREV